MEYSIRALQDTRSISPDPLTDSDLENIVMAGSSPVRFARTGTRQSPRKLTSSIATAQMPKLAEEFKGSRSRETTLTLPKGSRITGQSIDGLDETESWRPAQSKVRLASPNKVSKYRRSTQTPKPTKAPLATLATHRVSRLGAHRLLEDENDLARDTTTAIDYSVADSEDFSMVSIGSLKAHQEAVKSCRIQKEQEQTARKPEIPQILCAAQATLKRKRGLENPFEDFGEGSLCGLRASLAMGQAMAQAEPVHVSSSSRKIQADSHAIANGHPEPLESFRLPTPANTVESSGSPVLASRDVLNEQQLSNKSSHEQSVFEEMAWEPQVSEALQDSGQREEILGDSRTMSHDHLRQHAPQTADIWLDEANTSLENSLTFGAGQKSRRKQGKENRDTRGKTMDFANLLAEDSRPPRAKIPRTWRRSSGNHFLYSDEQASPVQAKLDSLFEQDAFVVVNNAPSGTKKQELGFILQAASPLKNIWRSPLRKQESLRPPKDVQYYRQGNPVILTSSSSFKTDSGNGQAASKVSVSTPNGSEIDIDEADTTNSSATAQTGIESGEHHSTTLALDEEPSISDTPTTPSVETRKPSLRSQDGGFGLHGSKFEPNGLHLILLNRLRGMGSSLATTRDTILELLTFEIHGAFSRLSNLLLAPLPQWNRNHYLLLERHWRSAFRNQELVLEHARATLDSWRKETLATQPILKADAKIGPMPADILGWIGKERVQGKNEDGTTAIPMIVTEAHCRIVWTFVCEARDRGIPQWCDGTLTRQSPKSSSTTWPQLDPLTGRVLRSKERWAPWDVLVRLHVLWQRDVQAALDEQDLDWPSDGW